MIASTFLCPRYVLQGGGKSMQRPTHWKVVTVLPHSESHSRPAQSLILRIIFYPALRGCPSHHKAAKRTLTACNPSRYWAGCLQGLTKAVSITVGDKLVRWSVLIKAVSITVGDKQVRWSVLTKAVSITVGDKQVRWSVLLDILRNVMMEQF